MKLKITRNGKTNQKKASTTTTTKKVNKNIIYIKLQGHLNVMMSDKK